jgi:hypothetical protein
MARARPAVAPPPLRRGSRAETPTLSDFKTPPPGVDQLRNAAFLSAW